MFGKTHQVVETVQHDGFRVELDGKLFEMTPRPATADEVWGILRKLVWCLEGEESEKLDELISERLVGPWMEMGSNLERRAHKLHPLGTKVPEALQIMREIRVDNPQASIGEMARELNRRGVKTSTGLEWDYKRAQSFWNNHLKR